MRRASLTPAARDGLAVASMPAGVLAVHELRYRLAFGARADEALGGSGHGYLEPLVMIAAVLAALVVGRWLIRTARTWGEHGSRRRPARLWLGASAALLALYSGQELAEGALAAGHAGGLAGVFGNGGLWAIPAALLVGGLLTLVPAQVERAVARGRPRLAALRFVLPALTPVIQPATRPATPRLAGPTRSRAPPFT